MHRYVEVSHPIEAGMKTYPGLPEPRAEILLDYGPSRERYQGKAEFLIASLHLCGNTGTYVDSPGTDTGREPTSPRFPWKASPMCR
jgi:kynurenine formamidase